MKIVFFTNFINHHQVYLSDELYKLTDGKFFLVENEKMPSSFIKSGYPDFTTRPYVIQAWKAESEQQKAFDIGLNADIGITGSAPWKYAISRLRRNKITFNFEERALKRGIINTFSPEVSRSMLIAWALRSNHYSLCASAYNANDMQTLHAFNKRCYKWAYFTKVDKIDIDNVLCQRDKDIIRILWVGRFISWKRPDMVIELAEKLKKDGYRFQINMIGDGELKNKIQKIVVLHNLCNEVQFIGSLPNDEVLIQMQLNHIHIFTSNRREGWGAVLNESMSQGCCPIVSNEIGSAPFLISEGKNGFLFQSGNICSLYERIKFIIEHKELMYDMSKKSYETMRNLWSPKCGSEAFIDICDNMLRGIITFKPNGPCSEAKPFVWKYTDAKDLV